MAKKTKKIAYLLVPMILFILVVAIAGSIDGSVGGDVFIIGGLITFVVGIIACLMAQIGICHMAYNDGAFSKAFAISEIREYWMEKMPHNLCRFNYHNFNIVLCSYCNHRNNIYCIRNYWWHVRS